jgi:hypothetical protein
MPFVRCKPTEDPTTYSGYEIELFRAVATRMGLVETTHYSFSCWDWGDLFNDVYSNASSRTCDIGTPGAVITDKAMEDGLRFGFPTFSSGISVAIRTPEVSRGDSRDIFLEFSPFTPGVWAVFAGAGIFSGLAIFFLEYASGFPPPTEPLPWNAWSHDTMKTHFSRKSEDWHPWDRGHLPQALYYGLGAIVSVGADEPRSPLARSVAWMWRAMVLIMVAIYTANLAAILGGAVVTQNHIEGWTSLRTYTKAQLVTWTDYKNRILQVSSLDTTPMPWNTNKDLEAMLESVMTGTAKAVLLDTPVLRYYTVKHCELTIVGNEELLFQQAVVFPPLASGGMNTSFVDKYNIALAKSNHQGVQLRLLNRFMPDVTSACTAPPPLETTLSLDNLGGTWACFCICVGFFIALAPCCRIKGQTEATNENGANNKENETERSADIELNDVAQSAVPVYIDAPVSLRDLQDEFGKLRKEIREMQEVQRHVMMHGTSEEQRPSFCGTWN